MAGLLRGGLIPQAYLYPAARRATRALLRQPRPLRRERAQRLAPLQTTTSPSHLPDLGKQIAYPANREGVAQRLPAPAGPKRIEVDLALLDP
jgi:hypothetical protein